ncbi:MAG: oligosaccharide flippase family protein [Fusicatenibacter sp.]|nr:oligosaccharide flippase family protein [Fusicatenibacter sp.]
MKTKLKSTNRKMSSAARTSVWFTICNFLQRGTAFLTVPIFTRLLTSEEYGVCNVYFAWFEIFLLFTSLKIPYEGFNNGLIRNEEDKDGYTSSMLGLIMILTCISAALYVLFHRPINRLTGLSSLLMALMFVQLFFHSPLMLWTNRERFDFRYRYPVIVTMISTILNPLIAVIAVLNTAYRAEARIIASVLVQAFFGLIFMVVLFRRGKTFYKKDYWKFALEFNLPLFFYYVSQSVLNQSDRIMINYYEGSGKAAIYSVAYSAATIMQLLVSAINGSFHPWLYKKLKAEQYGEIRNTMGVLCLLIGAATLSMSAFAPDLVKIMATREYYEAIWIIPPVASSVFFVFLYMLFASVEMYFNENRGIMAISILCSAANVILNAVYIPRYGYLAAGWTTLVCYLLLSWLHFLLMKRACRKNQVREAVFPVKLLLLSAVVVILLTFVSLAMYRMNSLRYVILALEAVLLFAFRRQLLGVIKKIK